jgi:outer membrane lipoprotein-sorting protein
VRAGRPFRILGGSLFAISLSISSIGAGIDADLREIISAQSGIDTLETSFSQIKVVSLFDETVEASGTIVIEKPDFYCWRYDEPEPSVFYVDGMRTGSYRPESGDRDEVALDSRIGLAAIIRSVTSIITGNLEEETGEDYEISRGRSSRGAHSYTFRPRTEELSSLFSEVTIRFDKRTKLARELEIVESNGDATHMRFDGWRTGIAVDRSALVR